MIISNLRSYQAYNASVQQAMDVRGLPWGVQWEIARLVTVGYCGWKDITMSKLDCLKNNGLSTSPSDSPGPARVLNTRIAPDLEDFFRHKKLSSGERRASKEALATVCCPSTSHSATLKLMLYCAIVPVAGT